MDEIAEMGFEEALRELDLVVERIEGEELTLEESLALYERGQVLLAHCQRQLAAAELKLQQLAVEEL